ncbi:glycosyl hydrolase family 76-domain-containing protein [Neohortaea acidophila]|uniref:Glycosyl hydrolase family 76-domain-containing protein n=1 Tax=Neohortaea acidophila TaxID=245834 RepID=A0A6A6PLT0_9PEZI|nr:glycosyl hydrolase family 76-domain-containing protein [Neohortaea acidophila]KAF2480423.1 glycosyl hydrolase family 76-domain-containing protein [Neohortaea acidophila]
MPRLTALLHACFLLPCLPPSVHAAGHASAHKHAFTDQPRLSAAGPQQLLFPSSNQVPAEPKDATALALPFDPLQELRTALSFMQSEYFAVWLGTWPSGIDWTRAVFNTHLAATTNSLSRALHASSRYGRRVEDTGILDDEINRYFTHNVAYYFGEDAFAIRYQAFDDILWVVLGWLDSINFIRTHSALHSRCPHMTDGDDFERVAWHGEQFIHAFAHRARVFWELTTVGWDTKLCGGGMVWNPRLGPYKNAITNQLFITASVSMYLYFPGDNNTSPYMVHTLNDRLGRFDAEFLNAAIKGYDWLKDVGMTNDQGLYVDGFHVRNWKNGGTKCNDRNEMVYTYNQGVILSGLRGLWESTGNNSYLEDAHELVRNVMKATGWHANDNMPSDSNQWAGLGRRGILEDACDSSGSCNQDGQTFKGIFMHHLSLLCEPLPLRPRVPGKTYCADKQTAFLHRQSCKQYSHWVAHNAQAALWSRDEKGRFGAWWGVRDTDAVAATQLPPRAIDYRNDPDALQEELWLNTKDSDWMESIDQQLGENFQPRTNFPATQLPASNHEQKPNTQGVNDRGRGRTVETQSGGVAVLNALWRLLNNGG